MLLSQFEYARPATIARALELLGSADDARVLAGGQSLINVMKARAAEPGLLVDLGTIAELRGIAGMPDGSLAIGAMTRYADILASADVAERRPILAEVVGTIADVQIRNRGTVGGNVCANDPTNHLPPLLVALGTRFHVMGSDGTRTVEAEDFFRGVYETAVAAGELLAGITVPGRALGAGDGWAAQTLGRDGTGVVTCAVTATVADGVVTDARVVLGCVGIVPARLREMEARLIGSGVDEEAVAAAAAGSARELTPPGDVHASADFRRHLAEVLARRATMKAIQEAI